MSEDSKLFTKLEDFNAIIQMKILWWCAIFVVCYGNIYTEIIIYISNYKDAAFKNVWLYKIQVQRIIHCIFWHK